MSQSQLLLHCLCEIFLSIFVSCRSLHILRMRNFSTEKSAHGRSQRFSTSGPRSTGGPRSSFRRAAKHL